MTLEAALSKNKFLRRNGSTVFGARGWVHPGFLKSCLHMLSKHDLDAEDWEVLE